MRHPKSEGSWLAAYCRIARGCAQILVASLGAMGWTACGGFPQALDDSDSAAPTGIVALDFDHRIDGRTMELGQGFITRYGQELEFSEVRYWVSNIALRRGDEWILIPESYYLVEQTESNTRTVVEFEAPLGRYEGLAFHIGVDPAPNRSLDLAVGELEAGIGMDWSWDTGYKFFRTEGKFVQNEVTGDFVIHTGNDVLYKRLEADFPRTIEVEEDEIQELPIEAELDRLFAGIEFPETPTIQGGTVDSVAGRIAGNYSRMYVLVRDGATVRFEATSPNLDPDDDGGDVPTDGTAPVLAGSPIALPETLACGEVPGRPTEEERACMTPFILGEGDAYHEAGLFTFVAPAGTPVRAASTGVVSDVTYVEHSDLTHSDLFDVSIRPNSDSAFWVDYRHVKNLRVGEGDMVEVGQPIAEAGDYFDAAWAMTGFGVRRRQEVEQRLCPTRYTNDTVTGAFQTALETSNAAWPGLIHEELCSIPSVVCRPETPCQGPADFVPAHGDVDAGRRIYAAECTVCHGSDGMGGGVPELCSGDSCACETCVDFSTLVEKIESDMPPEGECRGECAQAVAAFILHEFARP